MTNEELIQQLKKAELVVAAMQQRIAELELDKAMLRAEYTMIQQSMSQQVASVSEEENGQAEQDYVLEFTVQRTRRSNGSSPGSYRPKRSSFSAAR